MTTPMKNMLLFAGVAALFILAGIFQSWNVALGMLVVGLVSSLTAMGVNMQWGYAGLFNVGVMGFTAFGGLAMVLIATPARPVAWEAGGWMIPIALLIGAAAIFAAIQVWKRMQRGTARTLALLATLIVGFIVYRAAFDPAASAVEAIHAASPATSAASGLPGCSSSSG
jgi:branched-chain amino acid transport system permease protein